MLNIAERQIASTMRTSRDFHIFTFYYLIDSSGEAAPKE